MEPRNFIKISPFVPQAPFKIDSLNFRPEMQETKQKPKFSMDFNPDELLHSKIPTHVENVNLEVG